MLLEEVTEGVEVSARCGKSGTKVRGIAIDAKAVQSGDVFVCIKGARFDGHDFAREAEANGACALVTERKLPVDLPQVVVPDARAAMSRMAANFYGKPSEKLKVIGITGTNGKTTTSYMIKSILERDGKKVGVIGTLGIAFGNRKIAPALTTPDPVFLQRTLAEMAESGVEYAVMEVSAHALELRKVRDVRFEVAVFTNFTQDHLDFFGTMERYRAAKRKLFTECDVGFAILNADDETGRAFAAEASCRTALYGVENPADAFALDVRSSADGVTYLANLFDAVYEFHTPMCGRFNVYNSLAAAACCAYLGVKINVIAHGLYALKGVDGRIEKVAEKGGAAIYVDFAHTPDGLLQTLRALRAVARRRLVCLFGCGGNRDAGKRPIMGRIAAENADFTIITSDNPRYEDPLDIMRDIEEGFFAVGKNCVSVQNRYNAIKYAIDYIGDGDVLVLCGKGGEEYQEIMGIRHRFGDKRAVLEILKKR